MDIESVLKGIVDDPANNKYMLDGLSIEQLQELEKKTNVFKRPAIEFKKDINKALCSIVNLKEDYIYEFMLISVIGYIYRCLKEYTPEEEDTTWVELSRKERDEIDVIDEQFTTEEITKRVDILSAAAKRLSSLEDKRKELIITSKVKNDDAEKLKDICNHINTLKYVISLEFSELGIESDKKIHKTKIIYEKIPNRQDLFKSYTLRRYTTPPEPGVFKVSKNKITDIIQNFLDKQYKFNPDKHVQDASKQKISWYNTKQKKEFIDSFKKEYNNLTLTINDLKQKTPVADCHIDDYNIIVNDEDFYKATLTILREESSSFRRIIKTILDDNQVMNTYKSYLYDKDILNNKHIIDNLPPEDVFNRCINYIKCNREELRLITDSMRIVAPHIDTALIVYTTLNGTEEEVKKALEVFKKETMVDINNDICELEMNKWTIVANSKKNTEVVEMYNKNENVLSSMLEKAQDDKVMSREMLKKDALIKKAKNIRKEGADADKLADYIDTKDHDMSSIIDKEITKYLNATNGDLKKAHELQDVKKKIEEFCDMCEVKEERGLTKKEQKKYECIQEEIQDSLDTLELPSDCIKSMLFHTNSGVLDRFEIQMKENKI